MGDTKVNLKLNKKVIIIIAIIVVILIIAISVMLSNKNTNIELGNIANLGLAASSEEGIFYNKYEDGIVKVKGSEEFQITNETAYSINVVGEDIYYLSIGDTSNINIRKVKSNGSGLETIKTIKTSISKIYVLDNYIYYATNENEDGIAKLTLDGKEEKIITSSEINDFEVIDNMIYFTNKIGDIYKMTVNGTELEKINTEYEIKEFQVKDEWIYYFNEDNKNLCKVNTNGKDTTVVSEYVNSNIYNITADKIYFFDIDEKKIASVNLNGQNYKEIVNISTNKTRINVVGDMLYYLDASNSESKIYQIYRIKTNGKSAKSIEY